jgi:hypothetical protein
MMKPRPKRKVATRAVTKSGKSEVVIHGRDGRIVSRDTAKGRFKGNDSESASSKKAAGQPMKADARKAEALRIASKHGAAVRRLVERVDFSDTVTARERGIAERLRSRAKAFDGRAA